MPDRDNHGIVKRVNTYLNGHKNAILTSLGGILLLTFAAGGSYYSLRAEVSQVKKELEYYKTLEDKYISRREMKLNLEPLNQKITGIEQSVEEIKQNQRSQNQEILRELRRIGGDG